METLVDGAIQAHEPNAGLKGVGGCANACTAGRKGCGVHRDGNEFDGRPSTQNAPC